MTPAAAKLLRATIHSAGLIACFVVECCKWVAVVGCVLAMAFSFMHFGFHLERSAAQYAHGKRMETLKALYSSVDWGAIVRSEKEARVAAEERLKQVCKKAKRLCT